jgi:hypothetical protein|tara:strand:+ start:1084 stop:1482 length:399 start_codon:yes stop_codon:yes gene_type:complete
MSDLIVVKRKGFQMLHELEGMDLKGTYIIVTKCNAGYPTVSTIKADSPYQAFRRYQTGAIMNISFMNQNVNHNFTIYARQGKKVWMSPELAKDITVADINDGSQMVKTSLYSHEQYKAVNAKTWASKVFIQN